MFSVFLIEYASCDVPLMHITIRSHARCKSLHKVAKLAVKTQHVESVLLRLQVLPRILKFDLCNVPAVYKDHMMTTAVVLYRMGSWLL